MTDSELELLDPALIGSLRADFQPVDSGARELLQRVWPAAWVRSRWIVRWVRRLSWAQGR